MKALVIYLLWPNPAGWTYQTPQVVALLIGSFLLIAASFALRFWRRSLTNEKTKILSRSWPSLTFWYGFVALFLTVSRTEGIQFISMRLLWIIWAAFLLLSLAFQVVQFRKLHYTVIGRANVLDEREKYLPRKK